MTKIEKFFLRVIFKKQVRQSASHAQQIAELYQMIHQAAREEFTEDNDVSLDAFLREVFESTQTCSNARKETCQCLNTLS